MTGRPDAIRVTLAAQDVAGARHGNVATCPLARAVTRTLDDGTTALAYPGGTVRLDVTDRDWLVVKYIPPAHVVRIMRRWDYGEAADAEWDGLEFDIRRTVEGS